MVKHPRAQYERMIKEFPSQKHYGETVPLYLCGDALKNPDTQDSLYQYLLRNSERFGTPQKGPFGIIFLDSDSNRVSAFLDDLFDDSKKQIYSGVERLSLDSVGSLL